MSSDQYSWQIDDTVAIFEAIKTNDEATKQTRGFRDQNPAGRLIYFLTLPQMSPKVA